MSLSEKKHIDLLNKCLYFQKKIQKILSNYKGGRYPDSWIELNIKEIAHFKALDELVGSSHFSSKNKFYLKHKKKIDLLAEKIKAQYTG